MASNLLVMSCAQHWRLLMYDKYIAVLKTRIATERNRHRRERESALLRGWVDLKREFEAQLAGEKTERREVTKALAQA